MTLMQKATARLSLEYMGVVVSPPPPYIPAERLPVTFLQCDHGYIFIFQQIHTIRAIRVRLRK